MSDFTSNQDPSNGNNQNQNQQRPQQQQQQFTENNNTNPFFEDVTDQRIRNLPLAENQKTQQAQQPERKSRSSSSSSSSRSVSSSSSPSDNQKWEYESIKQAQEQQNKKDEPNIGDGIAPKQAMKQKSQRSIRYKYCCKKCKHADRDRHQKACVCVVPRDQRRTHLGNQGCQTCGCSGCSKEDFIFRGEDPQYRPQDKKKETKKKEQEKFQARNGCCKNCMKAFSKSGKSCICQVPQDVRKTKLSSTGCKICGCVGCNPQDRKHSHKSQRRTRRSRSRSQRRKQKHSKRSHSRQKKRKSKSRSPEIIDTFAMNFHNIDRSIIGSMIINEYQIDPALLGFGIPQRSSSYLIGKNKQK